MRSFDVAADGVDPARVPVHALATGAKMPSVGLGTFGSDRFSAEAIAAAVRGAAEVGYRHFDCAAVYGNERLIGEAFQDLQARGLARDEYWVTSKLWNDKHGEADVIPACEQTLKALQLDYLDLYLVHWPFPNYHAPGVRVDSRDPHAVPYLHERYMKTWRQMEKLVAMGLVRHIGTSNMTRAKLELLLRDAEIEPAANEMELHPHFQQPDLFAFVRSRGLVPIGFCPIGSPTRPERDRTPDDTVDIEDPLIVGLARRLGIHPAEVCVKWAVQRGQVPIPFAVSREQYLGNLRAAVGEPLTDAEMQAIAGIDRRCRLIKGQVFLWEGARGWEDLWDEDGTIAGA
jgi:alcohol dehydrogenase (NADP+)